MKDGVLIGGKGTSTDDHAAEEFIHDDH